MTLRFQNWLKLNELADANSLQQVINDNGKKIGDLKKKISEFDMKIADREKAIRKSADSDLYVEINSAIITETKIQRQNILKIHEQIYQLDKQMVDSKKQLETLNKTTPTKPAQADQKSEGEPNSSNPAPPQT